MEPIYFHNIDPIFLDLGIIQIRYYGLIFSIAFLQYLYLMKYFYQRNDFKVQNRYPTLIEDYYLYGSIGAIIGLRLGHVMFYNTGYYFSNPIAILKIWEGGVASHGAYVGIVLATLIFAYRKKTSFYQLIDIASIPFTITPMLIRVANFINAEIVGRVSDVYWSVSYHHSKYMMPHKVLMSYIEKLKGSSEFQEQVLKYHSGSYLELTQEKLSKAIESMDTMYLNQILSSLPRHPAQFYEFLFCGFITSGILWFLIKIKDRPDGLIFASATTLYFVFRFLIEFFKEYQTLSPSGSYLTMGQYLSIPMIIFGLITLYKQLKTRKL